MPVGYLFRVLTGRGSASGCVILALLNVFVVNGGGRNEWNTEGSLAIGAKASQKSASLVGSSGISLKGLKRNLMMVQSSSGSFSLSSKVRFDNTYVILTP